MLVPFFTWNGFYAGINAGYGFGTSKWTDSVTGVSTGGFDINGALIGGTAGYNTQLGGFVLGIEGDIGGSFIKGATASSCITTCETSNHWLATLRGRLGYAFDRFLPYVTGGAARAGEPLARLRRSNGRAASARTSWWPRRPLAIARRRRAWTR
jgi:outer membrane immunogenic protein